MIVVTGASRGLGAGLVEMTRKRIGEGLLESMSETCPMCEGRGVIVDRSLLG